MLDFRNIPLLGGDGVGKTSENGEIDKIPRIGWTTNPPLAPPKRGKGFLRLLPIQRGKRPF